MPYTWCLMENFAVSLLMLHDAFGVGSSAPFRYDPNDLSMGDDDDSGSPRSAIKNLNFSKIAREGDSGLGAGSASLSRDSDSGSATSTTTRNGSASAFSPDWMREAAAAGEGESEGEGTNHAVFDTVLARVPVPRATCCMHVVASSCDRYKTGSIVGPSLR